jgi:hypothetical protein
MSVSSMIPGHVVDAVKGIFAKFCPVGDKLLLSHLSFDQSICRVTLSI